MAGPYDYSINIPQPPAQNFLQSLMGIRQLQQMEEQGALQQQQAAIAQQNAAFQAQMQPLQLQAEKERIKQIQAATGATSQAAAESKYKLDRQKELSSTLDWLSKPGNFTVDNLEAAAVRLHDLDPTLLVRAGEMRKAKPPEILQFLDKTADKLLYASSTGKAEDALKVIDERIKAAENDDKFKVAVPDLQELRSQIENNPQEVKSLIGISNIIFRPDKGKAVIEQFNELAKERETQAKTKKELAAAKVEEAKLTPGGKEMSDKQQSDINMLTSEAAKIRTNVAGLTDSVDDLLKFAEQFPKEFKSGGQAALQNIMSSISGDTTRAQNLRASIEPYTKAQWIAKASGLKGSLSDKESAMLQKGAPKVETAGPAELLNWARLAQKVELADANQKDFDAAWQQNVRSLQLKSPVEFEVAGVVVKPGDSYSKVLTKINAQNRKKNDEEIQADAARLKRIQEAEKSGQSPVPNMYNLGGAPQQQQPAYVPPSGVIIKSRK